MPFKSMLSHHLHAYLQTHHLHYIHFHVVANHGGRYLYVDDDNQIQADHNYDLERSPNDLASKGTVFDTGRQHQLMTNKGPVKYNMGGTPMDLQLEQINADEVCMPSYPHGQY